MDGRRRTAKSLANDVLVRQAVVGEIVAAGFDQVGPTAVARRAGFTTGAIYGRYENSVEMVIDTWLEELWPRYGALLERLVAVVVDGDDPGPGGLDALIADVFDGPPWVRAATEVLAVARRSDELAEVIVPQVTELLDRLGAGATVTSRRQAEVLLVVGAAVGSVIHDLAGLSTDGRAPMFEWARRAAATDVEPLPPLRPLDANEWVVDTGDPSRDRLLAACAEVIADVGFELATASRIARRAGVGTNWVYAEHDSKQALLVDTVEVLAESYLTALEVSDLAAGRGEASPLGAAALALTAFLQPARRTRRLTWVEAFLCARHHPAVADVLAGMWPDLFDSYLEAVGFRQPGLVEFSRPVLHLLAAELSGLTVLDTLVGPLDGVDWRQGLLPFGPVTVAAWRRSTA